MTERGCDEIGVREAAHIVGVHENTIRNWVKAGVLESARQTPAGYQKFSRTQVERLKLTLPEPPPADRTEAYKRGYDAGWRDAARAARTAIRGLPLSP